MPYSDSAAGADACTGIVMYVALHAFLLNALIDIWHTLRLPDVTQCFKPALVRVRRVT